MTAFLYDCHNRPRPYADTYYPAQDGWVDGFNSPASIPTRMPIMALVSDTMSTDCRYDASASDVKCGGCQHAKAAP